MRQAQGQTAAAASDSKSFPSLKTVPQQAPQTSSSEQRRQVAQGLVADRDNAKYTDQVLRAGGTPKPQSPPMQVARVAPAPPPKPAPASTAPAPQPAAAPQPALALKPALTAPAPQPIVAPKPVKPTPAPVQRVATARLPKLDLRPSSRTQVAAVSCATAVRRAAVGLSGARTPSHRGTGSSIAAARALSTAGG